MFKFKEEVIMIIKLSEIEKGIQRKIVITENKAEWKRYPLNGELIFNELTNELLAEINKEVIQELKGEENQEEVAFLILPYIVNVENDISLERFIKLMESKHSIIAMLYEGIVESINDIFNYSKIQERSNEIMSKLPNEVIIEETIEQKINKLENQISNEKDTKKKPMLLMELAKLYEQVKKDE
jgi:hypothetical protein